MDTKYTQDYIDFFSPSRVEDIEKTIKDYISTDATFLGLAKAEKKLQKIYSVFHKKKS